MKTMSACCPPHQCFDRIDAGRVSAHDPVLTEQPDIARLANRLGLHIRDSVLVRQPLLCGFLFGQQAIKKVSIKPEQVGVEVLLLQPGHLLRQHAVVPPGVERQLVVGYDVGAPLALGHPPHVDGRHLRQPELLGRHDTTVARHDAIVRIHQHWVGKSKLPDAGRDLRHLLVAVRAAVARVWKQGVCALLDDLLCDLKTHVFLLS